MSQTGPRDTESVLAARPWLTDKGWATARQIEVDQHQQEDQ